MATMDPVRFVKLERLARGGKPRVVDLFSGCGGISVGFTRAGFKSLANVELDGHAAASYAANFHSDEILTRHALFARSRDMTQLEPEALLQELYPNEPAELLADVIVGGPPCQAFARVGRAKLREVAAHPDAFKQDPRGNLYLRYLHYVQRLKPLALVMENVPDVLNYGGHNIPQEMAEWLEEQGYDCKYSLLNAVNYGVPEMRERLFLMAIHRSVGAVPTFPQPTHHYNLPPGYEGVRRTALRYINVDQASLLDKFHFVPSPDASPGLPPAVTAREALDDLPPITAHLEGKLKKAARRFEGDTAERAEYRPGEPNAYQAEMRNWPGFANPVGVYDHVIRYLPRDYPIFRLMNGGEEYPAAHQHALNLLEETLREISATGEEVSEGSARYQALLASIVPPYDPTKFPNKWRKMEEDKPARTLMAHLGKDSYSHIHYDREQARTISVREAARLQSFPDGFVFKGFMNAAFRQVGNAVPPMLAWRLAETLHASLKAGLAARSE